MEKKDESLKYEVARELGLLEKVNQLGWKGLSPKETGRIGGLMTRKKRILKKYGKPAILNAGFLSKRVMR